MDGALNWNKALEHWPTPIFIIDRDWRFVFRNRAAEGLCPKGSDTLEDLLSPDSGPVLSLLRNAGPPPAEPVAVEIETAGGENGLLTAVALPDGEMIAGEIRLAGMTNLSDPEKMEGTIQLLRALGHDMAQPLTVILGQAEMLTLTHGQDVELIRRIKAIITEAEKLELIARKISETIHQARKL
jgi:nitrogen-specific signal transduction histidine kinase